LVVNNHSLLRSEEPTLLCNQVKLTPASLGHVSGSSTYQALELKTQLLLIKTNKAESEVWRNIVYWHSFAKTGGWFFAYPFRYFQKIKAGQPDASVQ
jgi:hypothetical protein